MAATTNITSARSTLTSWDPFINFVKWYTTYDERFKTDGEEYANMAFGNPQDRPLPEFVAALRRQLTKVEAPDTFAYKFRFPESVDAVVDALERTRGIQNMDPADVTLTNGALSALSLCLFVLADPGDEALYISPSYFLYKPMMEFAGLIPVAVAADPNKNFDLDVEAIRNALTPKTRVIIINSPNNPTGKIYPPATLEKLAQVLRQENQRRIRQTTDSTDDRVVYKPIMVISDEAYCRIIFDQDSSSPQFVSVAQVYEYSVMVYTWGKTLLAPSERFGYIATSPLMPESDRILLRDKFFRAQLLGWSFPNGTTAQAYAEIEAGGLKINVNEMKSRRDWLYSALTGQGWNVIKPEGSFYMMVQVPKFMDEDDLVQTLAEQERVLVLNGSVMDVPGWVRLSLTASSKMVEFCINAFQNVLSSRDV